MAKQAVVYDYDTWQQLYVKNADQPAAPSSMTKIMTAYVIFQALDTGEISLDDRFRVSTNAYRREGSTMWLRLDTRISVEDLLKGAHRPIWKRCSGYLSGGTIWICCRICGTDECRSEANRYAQYTVCKSVRSSLIEIRHRDCRIYQQRTILRSYLVL